MTSPRDENFRLALWPWRVTLWRELLRRPVPWRPGASCRPRSFCRATTSRAWRILPALVGGAWEADLAEMCRGVGCGMVIGYAERDGDRVFNTALVLDAEGQRRANYRKIQLYGPGNTRSMPPVIAMPSSIWSVCARRC